MSWGATGGMAEHGGDGPSGAPQAPESWPYGDAMDHPPVEPGPYDDGVDPPAPAPPERAPPRPVPLPSPAPPKPVPRASAIHPKTPTMLAKFLVAFDCANADDPEHQALREELWQKFDGNGNGFVSLAEEDSVFSS